MLPYINKVKALYYQPLNPAFALLFVKIISIFYPRVSVPLCLCVSVLSSGSPPPLLLLLLIALGAILVGVGSVHIHGRCCASLSPAEVPQ